MKPAKKPPVRVEVPAVATPRAQRAARVLVVDDELDILRSTQMLLEQMDFEGVVLPDPDLVVEVAEEERPDVILQDLLMPGLDLADVMRRLRKNPKTRHIPVVLYSASSDVSEAAAQHDAAGFLTKPFSESALREVLQSAIRQADDAAPVPEEPPTPKAEADEAPRDNLNAYFHGYLNTISALNNYALYLGSRPGLTLQEKEACQEMTRLLLDLETRTGQLRTKLLDLVT